MKIIHLLAAIAFLLGSAVHCNPIKHVNLLNAQNSVHHHTNLYHGSDEALIVRRGQHFNVSITFAYKVLLPRDQLRLDLTYDHDSYNVSRSFVVNNATKVDSLRRRWSGKIVSIDGNQMNVTIYVARNESIGYWSMSFATKELGSTVQSVHNVEQRMVVLFNPWNRYDSVYMHDDAKRYEYVENQVGKVYLGSVYSYQGLAWHFGQFEEDVLSSTIELLERYPLSFTDRADPVKVSRALSAVGNVNEDNGLLIGRWSGSYDDGVAPWEWTGSVKILQDWYRNGGNGVKYGQCWVFAGTLTTMCRAIGIPARPITCFGSAHDTDDSLTIDKFIVEEDGRLYETTITHDSIWNFHAWTEAWFARYDIKDLDAGGWQTIDSTPQELSDAKMQTGPASIPAIKDGYINYDYDMHFVFGEVNSLEVTWLKNSSHPSGWQIVELDYRGVAPLIVTKKVGELDEESDTKIEDVEDLTGHYKYPPGQKRSLALMNAYKLAGLSELFALDTINPESDIGFNMTVTEDIQMGDDWSVEVEIRNRGSVARNVTLTLTISSTYYTGTMGNTISDVTETLTILPNDKGQIYRVNVTQADYRNNLVGLGHIRVLAMATDENGRFWKDDVNVVMRKPKLEINVTQEDDTASLALSLTNPFDIPLTNVTISMEVIGYVPFRRDSLDDVAPGETVSSNIGFWVEKFGPTRVVAILNAAEIRYIFNSTEVVFKDMSNN